MRPYEVTWWDDPQVIFETRMPWWVTASRTLKLGDKGDYKQYSVTAAVMAINPEHAQQQIIESYSQEPSIEWQFIIEQPFGWSSFLKTQQLQPGFIWDQRPH